MQEAARKRQWADSLSRIPVRTASSVCLQRGPWCRPSCRQPHAALARILPPFFAVRRPVRCERTLGGGVVPCSILATV